MTYFDELGGFTDDEIAAGVPRLVYGRSDADGPRAGGAESPLYRSVDQVTARILVSPLQSQNAVLSRLSQYVVDGEKDAIVARYAAREELPGEFVSAAIRPDGAVILLKGGLRKLAEIYPSPEIVAGIVELNDRLHRNADQRTVYARVGGVQAFFHAMAHQDAPGSQLDLPNRHMRHVLSAMRLHLSLRGMFGGSPGYWETIWKAEIAAAEEEVESPGAGFIPIGKRRIRLWRVPQMKPLSHFASPTARAILYALHAVPTSLPLPRYRDAAIQALATVGTSPKAKKKRRAESRIHCAGNDVSDDDLPF
ncbi:hypothetical protein [Luteimonas sp. SDU101]|uniref:hypothetical protein n=1 Tax=Luteimonas sp. SDU101 TaxID=3422593 RepID=UPI003EBE5A6E